MERLLIKSDELVPVEYIIYRLNEVHSRYSFRTYSEAGNSLLKLFGFSDIENVKDINSTYISFVRDIIREMYNILQYVNNNNIYVIGPYNKRNGTSYPYKVFNTFMKDRIRYSYYSSTINNPFSDYQYLVPYLGLNLKRDLTNKSYISDILYIGYIKKEDLLPFFYMLLYNETLINKVGNIIEMHYDENIIINYSINQEYIINHVKSPRFVSKQIDNMKKSLVNKELYNERITQLLSTV